MKYILSTIGTISLFLGAIGIFLPVLPTTPFLLLSAWCYSRSSKRLYHFLLTSKYLGPYIDDYNKGCIRRKSRAISITILWVGIIAAIFHIDSMFMDIVLSVVLVGVTIHLYSLKTI